MDKICQSCAMPLNAEEHFGTNKDGSKNEDYCTYCYQNGAFTSNTTMEEMVEICVPHMVNAEMKEAAARTTIKALLPKLKRWAI
jgi:hypothetical protein